MSTKKTTADVPLKREKIHAGRLVDWLMGTAPKQLIVLMGLPASGKSQLANRLTAKGAVAVSRDQVRKKLYGDEGIYGSWYQVQWVYNALLDRAFRKKATVVADGVHATAPVRSETLKLAVKRQIKDITFVLLDVPLETCLRRNSKRSRVVRPRIIRELHRQLSDKGNLPAPHEGRLVVLRTCRDSNYYRVVSVRERNASKS